MEISTYDFALIKDIYTPRNMSPFPVQHIVLVKIKQKHESDTQKEE